MLNNCGKCGASVTATAIYCSICGTRLAETTTPPVSKSADSPLTKAASALAKASGLGKAQSPSRFGLFVRGLSIVAGLLLILSVYLVYRNQTSEGGVSALNIVSRLDQFNQLVNLGKLSWDQGDFKAAIVKFEEAEKLVPNNTEMMLNLAQAYYLDGQVENAVAKYSRVVELDPQNNAARVMRAEIQLNRGLLKESLEDYQYLAVNGAPEQAARARQVLNVYLTNRSLEQMSDKPLLARNRKLQELPHLPGVGFRPGLDTTMPSLANGVPVTPPASFTEEPGSASALAKQHKDKGQYYLNAQKFPMAVKSLQDARKLAPDDNDLNYLLGQAYDRMKQYSTARRYYELCDSGVYVAVARNAAQNAKEKERAELKKQAKKDKTKKEETSDE